MHPILAPGKRTSQPMSMAVLGVVSMAMLPVAMTMARILHRQNVMIRSQKLLGIYQETARKIKVCTM